MALEIYIPNTGQGDCSFIKFSNGKNMLVDFNHTDVDVDILEFLRTKIPKKKHEDIGKTCRRINYFVNTHPHEDHIKGVRALNDDEFYIDEIWESNHRLYVPEEEKEQYQNYYDFLDLVNKLKKRNSVRVLKAGRPAFETIGIAKIFCFAPSSYLANSKKRAEIHAQCGVIRIEYAGNSVMFTGDSDRESWEKRIVPNYSDDKIENGKKLENLLKCKVLHASHHGSKDFFVAPNDDDDRYGKSIDKMKPSFTAVPVGKDNKHGHPHRIAMNIYKEKTKKGRVFTTKDDKSMYFAFKADGKVEYKVGLSGEELLEVKYSEEDTFKGAAATLTFPLEDEIELEPPKRPPKAKKEGYF
jgi:competence protein ComEC